MKNKMLKILEKNRGKYVKSKEIASALGVSRMAVSKAVHSLIEQGIDITVSKTCGYKIPDDFNAVLAPTVAAYLDDSYDNILCYESVTSTNELAKSMAVAGAPDMSTVIAEHQSGGRGRYGRSFHSPKNTGIYMSIILRPHRYESDVLYTVAAAVALRRVISKYDSEARIKWVNDIYIKDRKVAGILCEAVSEFESGSMSAVICGIGINLTRPDEPFPAELQNKAGYVSDTGINRSQFAAEVIKSIGEVMRSDKKDIIKEYADYSMLIGRKIRYQKNEEIFCATATGIDETGGLIVEDDSSNTEILRSGEVTLEAF